MIQAMISRRRLSASLRWCHPCTSSAGVLLSSDESSAGGSASGGTRRLVVISNNGSNVRVSLRTSATVRISAYPPLARVIPSSSTIGNVVRYRRKNPRRG
jgi:hypothetical protein